MSLKIDRINSILQKEISFIIANEVKDKTIGYVSVTAVMVTNDLSLAKVYITILNEDKKEDIVNGLNSAKGFIRSKLFNRVDMRNIPELVFIYDESINYGSNIENIISEIKKND